MSNDDDARTNTMTTSNTIELELTLDEVNLILESLGALPFARVYALIGRIQEQARAQLGQDGEQEPKP
ncbi:hypothetical protein ACNOYE_14590 [Nannocystaceae bacterium ST9]